MKKKKNGSLHLTQGFTSISKYRIFFYKNYNFQRKEKGNELFYFAFHEPNEV